MDATPSGGEAKGHPGVRAVEIALDILECIAFADDGMGVTQIASELGLAKGAAFRHLRTLTERGYVLQNPVTAHYQIGLRAQFLSRRGSPQINILAGSENAMLELRDAVGETVVLSMPDVAGARILRTLSGKAMVEIGVRPGSVLPFEASAQGKIFLAFAQRDFRNQIEKKNPTLARCLADAKTGAALERDLARVRKRGWIESRGEFYSGINAIAAPIFDVSSGCVGTIAVVGLEKFLPTGKSKNAIEQLLLASGRVSKALGYDLPAQRPAASKRRR